MIITNSDIENYDLSFINHEESIKYIKDILYALVLTQEYIDNEYKKMWDNTKNNIDIDANFVKLLNEMDGLNVFDYFTKLMSIYNNDRCSQIIYNNMKYYESHSGFSMSWSFINTQTLLILGLDEFRNKFSSH